MIAVVDRSISLARLVFIDGVRRRALLGLFLLALLIELAGLFFFGFVPRDIGRVLVDYVITVGWAAGMVYLLFHAVQVMSWGEDRRVIQMLIAHPLSRSEYVAGVFLGLLSLLLLLNGLLAIFSYFILVFIKGNVGTAFFSHLGLVEYVLAWCGVLSIQLMILSVIVLFSGLIRGSFGVLLITMSYCLISSGLPVALEFFKSGTAFAKSLLVGLTFFFPNFDRWDYKGLAVVVGEMPSMVALALDAVYVLLYCVLTLLLAAKVYSMRDIK